MTASTLVRLYSPSADEYKHVPPDDPPEYIAVSHVWGDTKDHNDKEVANAPWKVPVRFPGKTSCIIDAVTRLCGPSTRIWLDVLSVNQDDETAASPQLTIMSKIYSRAKRVVVFCDDDTATKLESYISTEWPKLSVDGEDAAGAFLDLFSYVAEALKTCEWTSRLWTLQEGLLAESLIFTDAKGATFDLHKFIRKCRRHVRRFSDEADSSLSEFVGCSDNGYQECMNWWNMNIGPGWWDKKGDAGGRVTDAFKDPSTIKNIDETRAVRDLIQQTYQRSCSRPHDRIFGLLGLIPWLASKITISYQHPPDKVLAEMLYALETSVTAKAREDRLWMWGAPHPSAGTMMPHVGEDRLRGGVNFRTVCGTVVGGHFGRCVVYRPEKRGYRVRGRDLGCLTDGNLQEVRISDDWLDLEDHILGNKFTRADRGALRDLTSKGIWDDDVPLFQQFFGHQRDRKLLLWNSRRGDCQEDVWAIMDIRREDVAEGCRVIELGTVDTGNLMVSLGVVVCPTSPSACDSTWRRMGTAMIQVYPGEK
ncbi:hypothetical protein HK104_000421, partial [Borealophlyctis nickersoniae]